MSKYLAIKTFEPGDAAAISAFVRSQPQRYVRFFYAIGSDEADIAGILGRCVRDVYSGVYWHGELIGIFMVRGWDEGYEIPSFGVLIDEKYRGGSLLRLTIDTAKLIAKLSGAKLLMAKLHPDNGSRRTAQRLGFREVGAEESTGNVVYHTDL